MEGIGLSNTSIKLLKGESQTITVAGKVSTGVKGTCTVTVKQLNHSEVIVATTEKTGIYAESSNIAEVRKGVVTDIPIPTGFTYVKGDEMGGGVITDGTSEFVWVPVPEINKMVMCKQHSSTSDCKIVLNAAQTELSCTVHNSTDICGKLYSSYGTNGSLLSQTYTQNSGYREPDLVTDYDNNTSYNNGLFTLASLNNEFKEMAVSVAKYKGFYVSRYEMSLEGATSTAQGTGTAQSVANVMSSTSAGTNTRMWYGLYSKAKTYTVSTGSVTSQMIWGSQYDAMMNWMSNNGIAVTSTASSTNLDITGEGTERSTSRITGSVAKDRLCNVFDLFGNSYEWTQGAYSTCVRIFRGGSYFSTSSPSSRYSLSPNITNGTYFTRLTLYMK